jgi:hypothetical protein
MKVFESGASIGMLTYGNQEIAKEREFRLPHRLPNLRVRKDRMGEISGHELRPSLWSFPLCPGALVPLMAILRVR